MTGAFQKSTLGATATLMILGMALFLGVLVMVTLALNTAGQRKAAGNRVGQQVQYAAESSLARANARLDQYAQRIQSINLPQGTKSSDVRAELARICNVPVLPIPADIRALEATGKRICDNPNRGRPTADQLAFFSKYSVRPASMTADAWQQEWVNMFSGQANTLVDASSGAITSTRGTSTTPVKGGLMIDGISMLPTGALRIDFSVSPLVADATLSQDGTVAARRRFQQDGSRMYGLTVVQPPYSLYQYLVNRRKLPDALGGDRLVFWDGDSFEGRVHANGSVGVDGPLFLANTSTGGPRFSGRFTTSAARLEWSGASKVVPASTMFPGGYQFGAPVIAMPPNAVKQRLAAAGIDPSGCANSDSADNATALDATMTCLATQFGSQAKTTDGVYYAAGTNTSPNSGSGFAGGIYVRGNVSNLKLTQILPGKWQRIEITQNGKVTAFVQTGASSWNVEVNGSVTRTLSNTTFNGMLYVEGNIGSSSPRGSQGLMGDGTDTGDIAPDMQMTIAAQGNIYLKQSLTYATQPRNDSSAKNVLGIFTETGNFLLDGPNNADLTVNATIMASRTGKGFGTQDFRTNRYTTGGTQPKINLVGGIIEEQSQGVGIAQAGGAGYSRNFNWDPRFNDPLFTPPFFPTQQNFNVTSDLDLNGFVLNRTAHAVASE